MAWRVAASLLELREQVNTAHPDRSKDSDGTIGDLAHARTVSDHNPDAAGVVRAFDLTHDPKRGVDIAVIAEELRASRDPRIKYVIANRRIFAGPAGPQPWVWRKYAGADPHTNHVHVSVVSTRSLADDDRPWNIPTLQEAEVITPEDIERIAQAVVAQPVPRPGNKPVALGAQVGAANVNAYRALQAVKVLQDPKRLTAAVAAGVKAAGSDVDVNALAKAIVLELVPDQEEAS